MVLDLLLDREPHSTAATQLVSAVERGELAGYVCATALTTIDYVVMRARDRDRAREAIETLLRIFEIAGVTRAVLESALDAGFDDFEDAVVHEAARTVDVEGIVTRNVRDFEGAELSIYSPVELVAALELR